MFITTKAKFEWNKELEKYVEVLTEGYKYEGELSLAQGFGQYENEEQDRGGGPWDQFMESFRSNISSEQSYAKENFGGSFRTYGEKDLFTKITKPMREATQKGQYDSFFQLQTAGMDATYVDQIGQIGYTKGGKAEGFAGGGDSSSVMDQLQIKYAQDVAGVESDITSKISSAQKDIRTITQQNQSTSLQLKQLAEADNDGGKK